MRFLAILLLTMTVSISAMAKDINVDVNGLVCDFCAQSIKKVLGKEDGVNNVDVNLETKKIVISMADDKNLSDEKIKQLITDAGYEVVSIKQ